MAQPLPTYLRSERRKWALTQGELAELLGNVTRTTISKYETLACTPSVEALFALQIVFGVEPPALFPGLSQSVHRAVIEKVAEFRDRLGDKQDARSRRKRELLDRMIIRSREFYEETS